MSNPGLLIRHGDSPSSSFLSNSSPHRPSLHHTNLSLPDLAKPFVLRTDASGAALGAVLEQDGEPLGFLVSAPLRRKWAIQRTIRSFSQFPPSNPPRCLPRRHPDSSTPNSLSGESPLPLLQANADEASQSSLGGCGMLGVYDDAWAVALQRCGEFASATEFLYQHHDLPTAAGRLGITRTYNQAAMKFTGRALDRLAALTWKHAGAVMRPKRSLRSLQSFCSAYASCLVGCLCPFEVTLGENLLRPKDIDLVDVFPSTVTPPVTKAFTILGDRASAHLEHAKGDQKAFADASRRPLEFSVGDLVRISTLYIAPPGNSQFQQHHVGPHRILERIGLAAYKLQLPPPMSIDPVFHVSLLSAQRKGETREGCGNSSGLGTYRRAPDGFSGYKVECILDEQAECDNARYLVKWKGIPDSDSTWEPSSNLDKCAAFLGAIRASRNGQLRREARRVTPRQNAIAS
ncbi:hypothetical protein Efla_002882 [Eimeria flavescens]